MHWLLHLFGADNGNGPFYLFGSGTGGILLQDGSAFIFGWLAKKFFDRMHATRMAQAAQHHRELKAQADEHHAALTALHRRHHQQILDQADAHHEALKAHLEGKING